MRILQATTTVSLAVIPSLLILVAAFGTLPLRVALAAGALAAVAMMIGRFVTTGDQTEFLPFRSFLSLVPFCFLCTAILFSMGQAPAVSDYITEAARSGVILLIPYTVLVIGCALSIQSEVARSRLIRSILISMALVPLAMLTYDISTGNAIPYFNQWIAGLRVQNTGLVTSPNVNALIGAAGALASLWLVMEARQRVFYAGIGAGVFYVLISQSQGVAISALVSGLFLILPRLITTRRMHFAILIWLLSAPAQISLYSNLNGTMVGDMLTRTEAADQGVGTGRTLIWKSALEEISSHPLSYILGTGYMSATSTSVISAIELAIKPSDAYDLFQRTYTLHNTALQYFFDTGLLGLGLLAACLRRAASQIATYSRRLNAITFYFLISGLNEAIGAPYVMILFLPFLALIGMNIVGRTGRTLNTRPSGRSSRALAVDFRHHPQPLRVYGSEGLSRWCRNPLLDMAKTDTHLADP